jgi:hypothetical protein
MSKGKKAKKKPKVGWTPFEKAVGSWSASKLTRDELVAQGKADPLEALYMNSKYTVGVSRKYSKELGVEITHLDIKRNDKAAVHDWRDLQRIKNELCGPEREGIELYPAEQRLVDSANSYHLWVFPDGFFLPLGWTERLVMEGDDVFRPGHARQRPWPKDNRPPDIKTQEQAEAEYLASVTDVDDQTS